MRARRPGSFPAPALAWGLVAPAGMIAIHAYAADYLSVPQAQHMMFPAATSFVEQPASVTAAWIKSATGQTTEYLGALHATIWEARQGDAVVGWFVTDAVIGKFEKINYAVALAPDGTVQRVEILSYREKHGQQVRARDWLAQFEGKNAATPIRLNQDIRNITDATLSCAHLTDGIRRIALVVGGNARR